jgi:hypothetical protein
LWAGIVSILATLRIEKAQGIDGHDVDVKKQFTTGLSMFVDDVDGFSLLLIHITDTLSLSVAHL